MKLNTWNNPYLPLVLNYDAYFSLYILFHSEGIRFQGNHKKLSHIKSTIINNVEGEDSQRNIRGTKIFSSFSVIKDDVIAKLKEHRGIMSSDLYRTFRYLPFWLGDSIFYHCSFEKRNSPLKLERMDKFKTAKQSRFP